MNDMTWGHMLDQIGRDFQLNLSEEWELYPDYDTPAERFVSRLIKLSILEDDFEYRHTTNGKDFCEYDGDHDHRAFYEYIRSKPMYQLMML